MIDESRSLEEKAKKLEQQANSTLDAKKRAELRSLANDLKRQAQMKRQPH